MTNCNDCNNKTDGTCCHQSISNVTEIEGNPHSIKRNVVHTEMMQEQRAQKYLYDNINNHERIDGVTEEVGGN